MTKQIRLSLAILTLACGSGLKADGPAIRPHPDGHTYPASASIPHGLVAAAALSARDVKNAFATDLNKGYLVFEVAFYPNASGELKISPADFVLKLSQQDDTIRPAEPSVVARNLQEKYAPKQASGRTVDIYPVASVGYDRGTYNDGSGPNSSNSRYSGWHTTVGVGIGVGGPGSAYPSGRSSDRDRGTMEAELFDKSLPEGPITQPTAGYLYFPAPKTKQKAGVAYQLQYLGDASTVKLAVPIAKDK